jgi:polysaccharide deacetylase 2 family uncharacterized protein YibQ
MRSALSLVIIIFALCALAGGYFSGSAAVPHIAFRMPTPDPVASVAPVETRPIRGLDVPQTDEMAYDDFAGDPAVVSDASGGEIQRDARLAVVLVGCGHSFALESPFLALDIPMTLVIDPDAPAAHAITGLARENRKIAIVQAAVPITPAQLDIVQHAFPDAAGIAARLEVPPSANVLRELRARNLAVLDEYGDAPAVRFAMRKAGVRYASRTITVDDHLQPSYVQYMLDQAVHLGRGQGATILARPLPGTLRALAALIAQADRDGVEFVSAV